MQAAITAPEKGAYFILKAKTETRGFPAQRSQSRRMLRIHTIMGFAATARLARN
jgi:hypothetical protein